MKILFTGGGTGGHFYPIIAVIDELNKAIEEKKIVKADIIFMSDSPYDSQLLFKKGIRFKKIYSGKIRRYFSLLNITDSIKTFIGSIKAVWSIYTDFPDIIFSKGGYASFPAVFASRILGIPLIIHESDTVPGKVNAWSGKFAKRIAISFEQTGKYFPKEKIALTGNPVRNEFFIKATVGTKDFFKFEEEVPILFFVGGSQGAKKINDIVIDILPELVKKYQVIHQCGKNNKAEAEGRAAIVLEKSPLKNRYRSFGFMDENLMRMAYGAADLVVSRAGSGSIFEIAASGLPSILIPLSNSAQDHQKENAYAYAKTRATDVVEEPNLTPNTLLSEIDRLINNKQGLEAMAKAAKNFSKPDAAGKIAKEILNLALEHA
ncbi:MAG: undecaprenyldiphospho-muramoylpentapeptide beta-N-acetylglucosaminyltransferase [Candidatus Paceibacterota bacterium]